VLLPYLRKCPPSQLSIGFSLGCRVVLIHEPDREDYARRYKIDVSSDREQWLTVFEGRGEPGRSGASFNPVRARFVRITAI
jgi:F5/8 type C domain